MKIYRAWYWVYEKSHWIIPGFLVAWVAFCLLIRKKNRTASNRLLIGSWILYVALSVLTAIPVTNSSVLFSDMGYNAGREWELEVGFNKWVSLAWVPFFSLYPIACHYRKWNFWHHAIVFTVASVIILKITLIVLFSR
jgi:hypothetical protein